MGTSDADKSLLPSVLDRLTGKVASGAGSEGEPRQDMRQLKRSVREDLENLLNTRWRCTSWNQSLKELDQSIVNYGIPDFSGLQMSSLDDQESFRRVVEKAIRTFEPRFVSVAVQLVEPDAGGDRTLRFRIVAELRALPVPEPVVFDSAVDPTSSQIRIGKSNS